MTRTLLVLSPESNSLTLLCLGLLQALDQRGIRVGFFKPIAQREPEFDGSRDRTLALVSALFQEASPATCCLDFEQAEDLASSGQQERLESMVLAGFEMAAQGADLLIVEGVQYHEACDSSVAAELNLTLARCLDPLLAVLVNAHDRPDEDVLEMVDAYCKPYERSGLEIFGAFLNCVPAARKFGEKLGRFLLLGCFPFETRLTEARVLDVVRHLDAKVLHGEAGLRRRLANVQVAAMTVGNALPRLRDRALVVTAGDRDDIVLGACCRNLARDTGPLAGVALTGGLLPSEGTLALVKNLGVADFPIFSIAQDTFETVELLRNFRPRIEVDDLEMATLAMEVVGRGLRLDRLIEAMNAPVEARVSPAAFRYRLVSTARQVRRTIVLPEGDEPRTLQAAHRILAQGMAGLILLGDPEAIRAEAARVMADISQAEIIDPETTPLRETLAEELARIRAHKGLTVEHARDMLLDPIYLGTMMVQCGQADGLVSGAIHTTAHTIRPAFQIIRSKAEFSIVSSVFFMCLDDRVLVYGDCAVNPDPSAEQLAEIAVQSAQTARAFGIEPVVAMLSYSTGSSGHGAEVEKVRKATALARARAPDIPIDGPLQYDAAAVTEVAAQKAPDSKVAGKANVLIFPDLNTGNTTYKAVQRSASAVAIGPVLQGLNKPVNDLSRGALVDDIVYTIVITAIQAAAEQAARGRA